MRVPTDLRRRLTRTSAIGAGVLVGASLLAAPGGASATSALHAADAAPSAPKATVVTHRADVDGDGKKDRIRLKMRPAGPDCGVMTGQLTVRVSKNKVLKQKLTGGGCAPPVIRGVTRIGKKPVLAVSYDGAVTAVYNNFFVVQKGKLRPVQVREGGKWWDWSVAHAGPVNYYSGVACKNVSKKHKGKEVVVHAGSSTNARTNGAPYRETRQAYRLKGVKLRPIGSATDRTVTEKARKRVQGIACSLR